MNTVWNLDSQYLDDAVRLERAEALLLQVPIGELLRWPLVILPLAALHYVVVKLWAEAVTHGAPRLTLRAVVLAVDEQHATNAQVLHQLTAQVCLLHGLLPLHVVLTHKVVRQLRHPAVQQPLTLRYRTRLLILRLAHTRS